MTAEELAANVLSALAELQQRIREAEDERITVEIRSASRGGRTVLSADMVKHLTAPVPEVVVNVERKQTPGMPHKWAGMDYSKVAQDGTKQPATYADYCAFMGIPVGANEKID